MPSLCYPISASALRTLAHPPFNPHRHIPAPKPQEDIIDEIDSVIFGVKRGGETLEKGCALTTPHHATPCHATPRHTETAVDIMWQATSATWGLGG